MQSPCRGYGLADQSRIMRTECCHILLRTWPQHRLRPLVEKFSRMLMEKQVYREIFGVI